MNGSSIKAYAMAIDKNGQIVLAGEKGGRFFLTRLLKNGDLDTSFANQGYVENLSDGSQTYFSASFVTINNDGSIIVTAAGGISSKSFASLTKFKSNGDLDSSFGTDGFVSVNGFADAMVDKLERIVVVASKNGDIIVERYNSNGSKDASFKKTSLDKVITDRLTVSYRAVSLTIDKSNRIVVLGEKIEDEGLPYHPQEQTIILRALENGLIDSGFGDEGLAKLKFGREHNNWIGSTYEYMSDIAIGSSGSIIIVGNSSETTFGKLSNSNMAIARLLDNGDSDEEFGPDGIVTRASYDNSYIGQLMVGIDWDGKVIVTGSTARSYFIARFLP